MNPEPLEGRVTTSPKPKRKRRVQPGLQRTVDAGYKAFLAKQSAQAIDPGAETIEGWAYVEIYGHHKIAGRLSTRKIGTEVMFQVDVPKGDTGFSHSELYGPKSIFSIKPTTEEWCRRWIADALRSHFEVLPYIPETRRIPETVTPGEFIDDGEDEEEYHQDRND